MQARFDMTIYTLAFGEDTRNGRVYLLDSTRQGLEGVYNEGLKTRDDSSRYSINGEFGADIMDIVTLLL